MCIATRTQTHGPNAEYHRIAIPKEISKTFEVQKGDIWIWDILEDHSVHLRLIK